MLTVLHEADTLAERARAAKCGDNNGKRLLREELDTQRELQFVAEVSG